METRIALLVTVVVTLCVLGFSGFSELPKEAYASRDGSATDVQQFTYDTHGPNTPEEATQDSQTLDYHPTPNVICQCEGQGCARCMTLGGAPEEATPDACEEEVFRLTEEKRKLERLVQTLITFIAAE